MLKHCPGYSVFLFFFFNRLEILKKILLIVYFTYIFKYRCCCPYEIYPSFFSVSSRSNFFVSENLQSDELNTEILIISLPKKRIFTKIFIFSDFFVILCVCSLSYVSVDQVAVTIFIQIPNMVRIFFFLGNSWLFSSEFQLPVCFSQLFALHVKCL